MRTLITVLALTCLIITSQAMAEDGKPFADFNGQPRSVEEYFVPEKWTVVMIWRHDCHICNQEVDSYAFFHDGNPTVQVLGLSIDGQANKAGAENFIASYSLPFDNLLGELNDVSEYYKNLTGRRFLGTPTFLIFNPQGQLKGNRVGGVPPETIRNYINRSSEK